MSTPWKTSDLLDLDYFLQPSLDSSAAGDAAESVDFDRAVYLAYARTHTPPFDRRHLIKYWLDEKRAGAAGNQSLPGALFTETMSLMRILTVITAFVFGAILAWSVLSYSGTTPINIFTCVWILIVPQLLLLFILGLASLLSKMGVRNTFRGVYPLAAMLIQRLAARIGKTGQDALPSSARQRFRALVDLGRYRQTPYGRVLFWPVFILAQLFGVWFNLGLLASTGLKLAITDLAFGWQSTLFPDPVMVSRVVEIFSLPWSWAVAGAHPTISQIEGSRMVLKEGMVHLTTPDLVSWWPFLIFAILCYGLTPRILLLGWGRWKLHRALVKTSFATAACDRLMQRLQTPRLRTAGVAETASPSTRGADISPASSRSRPDSSSAMPMGPAMALVPEEIAPLFTDDALKKRIFDALGLDMKSRLLIAQDPDSDQKMVGDLLAERPSASETLRLVIVTEAWQPPLAETLAWLDGLRRAAGPQTGMIVALVGKPAGDFPFTAPARTDRKVWEQAVTSLNDPFTRVENLGEDHG